MNKIELTKEQVLRTLLVLSSMETLITSSKTSMVDYLFEELSTVSELLSNKLTEN